MWKSQSEPVVTINIFKLVEILFIIREKTNISMEHVYLCYIPFADLEWQPVDLNDCCEMEVSIKNSSPNTAGVTQWGMVLVPESGGLYIE